MPRGHEDYGAGQANVLISQVKDQGELAARLGSPVTLERSGNVVRQDNFSTGLGNWSQGTGGTGASVTINSVTSWSAGQCCQLKGGSDGTREAMIIRYGPSIRTGVVGLGLFVEHVQNCQYFEIQLFKRTPTERDEAYLYFDIVGEEIKIIDQAGATQVVGTFDAGIFTISYWHYVKLVVDFSENLYRKLIFDDLVYDLSDHGLYVLAPLASQTIKQQIRAYSVLGSNGYLRIDDVVFTINEPL